MVYPYIEFMFITINISYKICFMIIFCRDVIPQYIYIYTCVCVCVCTVIRYTWH